MGNPKENKYILKFYFRDGAVKKYYYSNILTRQEVTDVIFRNFELQNLIKFKDSKDRTIIIDSKAISVVSVEKCKNR